MDRHEISATFTERGAKGQTTAGADRQKARKALVELSVSSPAAATACKANIRGLRRRSIGIATLCGRRAGFKACRNLLYRANIPDCSAVEGFDVNNFHKDKV